MHTRSIFVHTCFQGQKFAHRGKHALQTDAANKPNSFISPIIQPSSNAKKKKTTRQRFKIKTKRLNVVDAIVIEKQCL